MKTRKVDRYGHAGKNWNEKEAYKNFLASKLYLDKTENEPNDINKTNESSFEEDEIEPTKIQRKSNWLKLKDFLYDNWIIAFISGIIIIILGGYITTYREQGIQGQQISTIQQNVSDLKNKNDQDKNNFDSLKENFNIFKAEISKDLDFIKKKLKL